MAKTRPDAVGNRWKDLDLAMNDLAYRYICQVAEGEELASNLLCRLEINGHSTRADG